MNDVRLDLLERFITHLWIVVVSHPLYDETYLEKFQQTALKIFPDQKDFVLRVFSDISDNVKSQTE